MSFENGFYPFTKHAISASEFNNDRQDAGYYIVAVPTKFIVEVAGIEKRWFLKGDEELLTTVKALPYPLANENYRMAMEVYAVSGKTGNRIQSSVYHSKYR